jgi:glycosidase
MFTMPGTPIMYYGDEIGMGDNIWLPDRNGVRTPMQWSDAKNGGFSEAETTYSPVIDDDVYGYKKVNVDAVKADRLSIYYQLRDMILKRKSSKVLQRGEVRWLESDDKELLIFERVLGDEKLTIVHNLSDRRKEVYFDGLMIDIYSGAEYEDELQPYEFVWLKEYKEY